MQNTHSDNLRTRSGAEHAFFSSNRRRKRRPPYANLLVHRAKAPNNSSQSYWILIGAEAWAFGRAWAESQHRVFAVCPPGENPSAFDWSMYRHAPPPIALLRCGVVDGEQLRALIKAMLTAGSPRLYDLSRDVIYKTSEVAL